MLPLAGLLITVGSSARAQIPATRLSGIAVYVARPGEVIPLLSFDSLQVSVQPDRVTVREGDLLAELIKARLIFPDGEAFAAAYTLNPTLDGPSLVPGTEIWIPALVGPDTLRRALTNGRVAYLTIDISLKMRVVAETDTLETIVRQLGGLAAGRVGGDSAKKQVMDAVANIYEFARDVKLGLQHRTLPVEADLLDQVGAELALVTRTLRPIVNGQRSATKSDRAAIFLVRDETRIRWPYWTESRGNNQVQQRYPRVRLLVSTLPGSGLRAYYAPKALHGRQEPHMFPELTPAMITVPQATYVVWASTPGSRRVVSEIWSGPVSAERDDTMRITLKVVGK